MGRKKQSPRRLGRERAFQVLYSCNFVLFPHQNHVLQTLNSLFAAQEEDPELNEFALQLVLGVLEHQDQLDKIIAEFSKNWRLERIARIELTIMRLALFEMLHRQDIPFKVAINEGIELSKKFGDDKSGRFVNGILDAIGKEISQGALQHLQNAS